LASIADAVITISNIGEAVFLNKQAEAITGWKTEEVKGLMVNHILNIYSENGKTRKIDINKDILSVKNTINLSENYYLLNKNSKKIYINCRAAPIITSLDKFIGVVMIIQDVTEKRIAELEISNSQKFIKRITDSIPSIVYIFNVKENRISYVNYKIEELLGFKADDVINSSEIFFEKVINPADLKKFQQNLYRYKSLNDFEIIEYEYRILNSKNDYKWFKSYEVVFSRDENGYTAEILGTAFDIDSRKLLEEELKKYSGQLEELVEYRTKELTYTNEMLKNEIKERKRAEKILTEAEEKFRSLVENSIVGIYIIQNDKYVYANPKFAEIFGYEKNEIIGMDIWKLVLPENKRIINEIINKGINNEIDSIQYTFKAIKKNQEIIEAEVKGTTMLYEGKISIIGTLQDVTERNKAEVLLNEQRKYLRSVIDTNPSFIFAKDWEGRFTLVNKAVAEVYGTTVNELIGKTDADYNKRIEEVEQFNRDDREVISSRISKFIPEEKVTNSVTGETRWYQTVKVPITGIDGRVQVLGVSSDITERKRAEELLMKSLNEKEMLLKEIHHRVKNNLQIIISLLKLQSGYVYDVRDIEIFNNSRSRIETMSLIHEKLYRTEDLSSIEISNYVKELVNHLIKAYNINSALVDFTVSSEKIYLSIDTAIPCGLIINELVNNTLKHAFPRGYRGKILINIKKENEIIFISIKDNGIGLPENLDEKVNKSLGLKLINTLIKQLD
jgi:PAS domain S-box-containing protein